MSIPMSKWGRDHWSTFAFVCATVVGRDGDPDRDKMRCDADRHPGLFGPHQLRLGSASLKTKHPTRLLDGKVAKNHDDWDCVDDFEAEKLIITEGTGIHPRWVLTKKGWDFCKGLVMFKCYGGAFVDFRPEMIGEQLNRIKE